jgi:drug/metabolite transporter (DMT)-like permease
MKAWLALIAVWFFWGTTYLGIRMALESISPVHLIALRFLISGALMLIVGRLSGAHIPRGRELWLTARNGLLMLGGGTGILVFTEQWVPSGIAALIITLGAFWSVGLESLTGGERLHTPTLGGMLVGFFGVAILMAPSITEGAKSATPGLLSGFLLLQVGCVAWSLGSILQKRQPTQAHPAISGAVQQLATGLAYLPLALLLPQHSSGEWTTRSLLAMAWLVMFGSIVAYSAYVYALDHLPMSIVTTYNYVNPVVAMFLGWLVYREPFGMREVVAMLFVFTGVAIVKYTSAKPTAKPAHSSALAASE